MWKLGLFVVILGGRQAVASPAACFKSPKDMTREAKVIVVAKPTSAKLDTAPGKRIHRGVYAVSSVIRGKKVKSVVVETSCRDELLPEREQGYPGAHLYCPRNLELPGFTTGIPKPASTAPVLLFLSDTLQPIDPTGFVTCDETRWPSTTADTIVLVKKLARTR